MRVDSGHKVDDGSMTASAKRRVDRDSDEDAREKRKGERHSDIEC